MLCPKCSKEGCIETTFQVQFPVKVFFFWIKVDKQIHLEYHPACGHLKATVL